MFNPLYNKNERVDVLGALGTQQLRFFTSFLVQVLDGTCSFTTPECTTTVSVIVDFILVLLRLLSIPKT